MTTMSGTGCFAMSASTAARTCFDESVNWSLPSTKYSVYDVGRPGCAASAAPNFASTSCGLDA